MDTGAQEVSVDFAAAMLAAQMSAAAQAARLYPRNEKAARKKLLKLCRDAEFAEQATFTVEHGSTLIYRPSINFARPAAEAWQHVHTGSRIIRTSHDEEHIEGWAFDAAAGRTVTQPGLVRKLVKKRDQESGKDRWVRLEGPDLIAARHREVSIVVRRAILDLLPTKLVDEAMDLCAVTLERAAAKAMAKEPIPAIAELLDGWRTQGVREEQLVRYLGRPLAELPPSELAKLAGILRGVREGSISVAPFLREPEAEVVPAPEPLPAAPAPAPIEPSAQARSITLPLVARATPREITDAELSDDNWK